MLTYSIYSGFVLSVVNMLLYLIIGPVCPGIFSIYDHTYCMVSESFWFWQTRLNFRKLQKFVATHTASNSLYDSSNMNFPYPN